MKTTIYIPEDQAALYEEAKKRLPDSISGVFVRCLQRELDNHRLKNGRIVVEVVPDPDIRSRTVKKAFEGRWLIGDENSGERYDFPEDSGARSLADFSVAITKAQRIVVVTHDRREEVPTTFSVYETFEDFSTATIDNYDVYPADLISAVSSELGIETIQELDI